MASIYRYYLYTAPHRNLALCSAALSSTWKCSSPSLSRDLPFERIQKLRARVIELNSKLRARVSCLLLFIVSIDLYDDDDDWLGGF
jgi:hypothetical protein